MADERPPVAIGHVTHEVERVPESTAFLIRLGLRSILERDDFAVLELRGGTHMVVRKADAPVKHGTRAGFDLIVDDVEATHRHYTELGLAPSPLEPGRIHTSFTVEDPSGYPITINSTHAGDRPI